MHHTSSFGLTSHQQKSLEKPYLLKLKEHLYVYMGVSKNRGSPKWMIYNGKPY